MANFYYSEQSTGSSSIAFKTADFFYIDDESISAASLRDSAGTAGFTLTTPTVFKLGGKTITLTSFNAQAISSKNFVFADGSQLIIADGAVGTTDSTNTIISGLGDDYIDGAAGTDTVKYSNSLSAVAVNLTTGASSGGLGVDKLAGIEVVIGSAYNDAITGGAAATTIDGGNGIDTMTGGAGNDTFIVTAGDSVSDTGITTGDLISSSIDYVLPTYSTTTAGTGIEKLTLTGTTAIYGTGNAAANTITGNSKDNILDGYQNAAAAANDTADTLIGGTGNDTYFVHKYGTATDTVTEIINAGTDIVYSAVDFTLNANVENLRLTNATGSITGTGNTLSNIIYASNSTSANTLDGDSSTSTAVDTVSYQYATTGVTVSATGYGASDSTVTVTRGSVASDTIKNFENFIGSSYSDSIIDANATGNNSISSGAGHDTITSGGGRDSLDGGTGNDIYVLNATTAAMAGISITDSAGTDTIRSADTDSSLVTFKTIENLTLTSASASKGVGNDLNNILIGGSAGDNIEGGKGNDTLNGMAGNDSLDGGIGLDTIIGGAGADTIIGNAGTDLIDAGSGADRIDLTDSAVEADKVLLTQTTHANLDTVIGFETADKDVLQFDISGLGLNSADYAAGSVTVITVAQASALVAGAWSNHIVVDTNVNIELLDLTPRTPSTGPILAIAKDNGNVYLLPANVTATTTITTATPASTDLDIANVYNGDSVASNSNLLNVTATNLAIVNGGMTLKGDGFANYLYGSSGNDTITAGAGSDTVTGAGGVDSITGGAGIDTVVFAAGDNGAAPSATVMDIFSDGMPIIDFGATSITQGTDTTSATPVAGHAAAVSGVVSFHANDEALAERIIAVNDALDDIANNDGATDAADGESLIFTFDSNSYVFISDGVVGIGANDVLIKLTDIASTSTSLRLTGGDIGGLNLTSGASAETISGGDGADSITGGAGADSLVGGDGADTITGAAAADNISGGDGADVITGGDGADVITGGADDDTFVYLLTADLFDSNAVVDSIIGGTGTDVLRVGTSGTAFAIANNDSWARVSGVETITAVANTAAVTIALDFTAETAGIRTVNISAANTVATHSINASEYSTNGLTLTGASTKTSITGGAGDDTITGGGAGDDTITGGAGADVITGGAGADVITGGGGVDIITTTGDAAADKFITGTLAADADEITGFVTASDIIDLSAVLTPATLTIAAQINAAGAADPAAGAALITTAADTDAEVYYILNTAASNGVQTLAQIETAITAGDGATGQVTVIVENATGTYIYTDQAAQTDAIGGAGLILQATLVGTSLVATGDLISV